MLWIRCTACCTADAHQTEARKWSLCLGRQRTKQSGWRQTTPCWHLTVCARTSVKLTIESGVDPREERMGNRPPPIKTGRNMSESLPPDTMLPPPSFAPASPTKMDWRTPLTIDSAYLSSLQYTVCVCASELCDHILTCIDIGLQQGGSHTCD